MTRDEATDSESRQQTPRRRFLLGVGAVGIAGVAAGCMGGDDDDDNGNGDDGNGDDGNGDDGNGDDGNGDDGNGDDGNGDDEPETHYFEVGDLEPDGWTVEAGESVNVSTTITNTGVEADEQEVELRLDNETLMSETVSLEPDEDEDVSFEDIETDDLGVGEYSLGIYSEDDDESETLAIASRIVAGATVDLIGDTGGWEGITPEEIEGVQNPTLILEEGEEYTFGWSDGDGGTHNIAIWDEDGNTVDDLATDQTFDPDEDQFLTFEATPEMYEYVCEPHSAPMSGYLLVE